MTLMLQQMFARKLLYEYITSLFDLVTHPSMDIHYLRRPLNAFAHESLRSVVVFCYVIFSEHIIRSLSNLVQGSVAVAQASYFQKMVDIKSNKIDKNVKIFEHIDLLRSQWVLCQH
jgi:hypothetical protein